MPLPTAPSARPAPSSPWLPLFSVSHICSRQSPQPQEVAPAGNRDIPPLSAQEVVKKLDNIPVFHLMNSRNQIFPVPDSKGEIAVRWYLDPDEANSALISMQVLNPDTPLQLGVTPLGTAYAFCSGWATSGAKHPLRLMPSRVVVAALAQELGAEPDESAFPVFGCDELTSARIRPFWTSAEDVRATWISAGRTEADFPDKLTVISMSTLVKLAMTANSFDGRTLMLIASPKATAMAQKLQDVESSRASEMQSAGLTDEPPPLADDEPPPLESETPP